MSIIGIIYTHTHTLTMYLILFYNKIFFKVTICHSIFRTFFTDFITVIRIKYNIIINIIECYFKRGKTN